MLKELLNGKSVRDVTTEEIDDPRDSDYQYEDYYSMDDLYDMAVSNDLNWITIGGGTDYMGIANYSGRGEDIVICSPDSDDYPMIKLSGPVMVKKFKEETWTEVEWEKSFQSLDDAIGYVKKFKGEMK